MAGGRQELNLPAGIRRRYSPTYHLLVSGSQRSEGEPRTQRSDLSASAAAIAIRAKAGSDFVSVFAMIDARWFSTVR